MKNGGCKKLETLRLATRLRFGMRLREYLSTINRLMEKSEGLMSKHKMKLATE